MTIENARLGRAAGGLGAALVVIAAALELVQVARPIGFPFWAWVVGTLAGLALLWVGLNAVRQELGARVVAALLALGIVLLIIVPFGLVVVLGAFQTRADLLTGPHLIPSKPTTVAFDQLMRIPYFDTGLRNSLLVSTTAAVVTTRTPHQPTHGLRVVASTRRRSRRWPRGR